MRFRMGKGQVLVFDSFIEKTLAEIKAERGFYPTLKEIADRCVPPTSTSYVDRSLRRLAAAGRLPKDALLVYNAKNNIKEIEGDTHEKTGKRRAEKR